MTTLALHARIDTLHTSRAMRASSALPGVPLSVALVGGVALGIGVAFRSGGLSTPRASAASRPPVRPNP